MHPAAPDTHDPAHHNPDQAALATAATPTPPAQRIEAIDALRGFVLLGILFMNMPLFGLTRWAAENPSLGGGIEGLDWWAWFLSAVLWDGKMRAIFSMLFGAGVLLLTRRAEAAGPEGRAGIADVYYKRTIWLILFGVFDAFVLAWPGDILYWYGLMGLLLFPFRKVPARRLIAAALVILSLGVAYHVIRHEKRVQKFAEVVAIRADVAAGKELTKEQKEKIEKWDERIKEANPPAEKVEKDIAARRGGYFSVVPAIAPIVMEWNSQPIYTDTDVLPMMLLGLGLAQAGFITGKRSTRTYLACAVVCLPLGWFVAGMNVLDWSNAGFSFEHITPYSRGGAWGYVAQRLLLGLGYISVVMLAARTPVLAWVMRSVAAAGRMPLTNYLTQSVICLFIFSGLGFGLFAKLSHFQLVMLTLAIWVPQVMFSVLWLNSFAYGPMEWFWRWRAYGEKPAWRLK